MKVLGIFSLLIAATFAANQYDNHQMWRITFPHDFQDAESFQAAVDIMNLDVWANGRNWMDVRVTPDNLLFLLAVVKEQGLELDIKIKSIGSLIEKFEKEHSRRVRNVDPKAAIQLDVYHTLEEIYAYLDELEIDSANMVTTEVVGTAFGGTPIRLVRIFAPGTVPGDKPAVWIDCGIHAREWITPATCIYGIDSFVNGYGVSSTATDMLDAYDFYILPVLNAEGYNYTWTDDRMWRKNRRDNDGSPCIGVDLNRNYDDGLTWAGGGSSSLECADTYHGPSGFSEAETSAVRDKVNQLLSIGSVKTFYSIHSYGQLFMYVYGCCDAVTDDRTELHATAEAGVLALQSVYGTKYEYGDHYNVIYQASGVAIDWSYTVAGITYSYLMELRDNGTYGFLLPEDQILPTAEETWTGIFAAIESQP